MSMRKHRAFWASLLAGSFSTALFWPSRLVAQCAMCRTALTNSEQGQRWAQGIDAGILLLLFAPFLIFGAIALRIYNRQVSAAVRRFLRKGRGGVSRLQQRARQPVVRQAAGIIAEPNDQGRA